jgi:hypothetical protein
MFLDLVFLYIQNMYIYMAFGDFLMIFRIDQKTLICIYFYWLSWVFAHDFLYIQNMYICMAFGDFLMIFRIDQKTLICIYSYWLSWVFGHECNCHVFASFCFWSFWSFWFS